MELKSTAPYPPPPPPLPPPPYSETMFQNRPQPSPYSYPYPGTPWPPNHPGSPPFTEVNFRDDHMMPTNSEVPLVLEVHKSKRGILFWLSSMTTILLFIGAVLIVVKVVMR